MHWDDYTYLEEDYNKQSNKSEKFWMITGDGNVPKVRHNSRQAAMEEAERLAKSYPQTKFYVLEAVTEVKSDGVSVTDL